jgi:hypothetical protein
VRGDCGASGQPSAFGGAWPGDGASGSASSENAGVLSQQPQRYQ